MKIVQRSVKIVQRSGKSQRKVGERFKILKSGDPVYSQRASLHPVVEMGTGEFYYF